MNINNYTVVGIIHFQPVLKSINYHQTWLTIAFSYDELSATTINMYQADKESLETLAWQAGKFQLPFSSSASANHQQNIRQPLANIDPFKREMRSKDLRSPWHFTIQ